MCGIAGFCDFSYKSNENNLHAMTNVIAYRGPDDFGYYYNESQHYQIGLGHRRLSILDVSPLGHQPYSFNKSFLIYNGEVYNFDEIKNNLIDKGYSFISHSDTEVIIKAYDAWGIRCIEKFIGMFSFALYDEKIDKLFLVRDRAGVKPMYYYFNSDLLLFGSELKSFHQHPAFKKELDLNSLALYFQFSYIPAPYTIFKNTNKLKPGYYLEIDLKSKKIIQTKYWDVIDHYNKPKLDVSFSEAESHLEKILISACEYRMVSDVPVGVFLSGGYDSSLVAALLQKNRNEKIKTFTIGFNDQAFNEAPFAKKVAQHLGTDHTEYYCTASEAYDIIPNLPDIYDEPFGDNSIIPTTLVSRVARKNVTVALSADGGDEIFAGYPKFPMALKYSDFGSVNIRKGMSSLMNLINPEYLPLLKNSYNFSTRFNKIKNILKSGVAADAMKIISQFNTEEELSKRLAFNYQPYSTDFDISDQLNSNNDDLNKMLAIDFKTFLVDNNLTKVDRATMSVSLEGREPLLDHRIVEFVAQLPSNYKLQNDNRKIILKSIVHKYVPKPIMDRPKMGFVVPIMSWFRNELKELMMHYMNDQRIKDDGLFNISEIKHLRDRFMNGHPENVQKLWHILIFQMWKERWLDNK